MPGIGTSVRSLAARSKAPGDGATCASGHHAWGERKATPFAGSPRNGMREIARRGERYAPVRGWRRSVSQAATSVSSRSPAAMASMRFTASSVGDLQQVSVVNTEHGE